MNYKIIFSPTGGTKKVADAITQTNTAQIDLTDSRLDLSRCSLAEEDLVLLAMPSFGGLAPQLAIERLHLIKGGGAKCILAAVYGNRAYEDTLVQMEDAAEKAGFRVIAAIAAVAEHSIMPQYATGRPDREDCVHLSEFAKKINDKMQSGQLEKPNLPGNRPYKKAGSTGLVPKADAACTECGLCAEKCPAQAIDAKNPKVSDGKKCISCMRCISICPQKARKVNRAMVFAASLAIKKACSVRKECELFL